jgi:hypothetical protein
MQAHGIGRHAILVTNSGTGAEIKGALMQRTNDNLTVRQTVGKRTVAMRGVRLYRKNATCARVENRDPTPQLL